MIAMVLYTFSRYIFRGHFSVYWNTLRSRNRAPTTAPLMDHKLAKMLLARRFQTETTVIVVHHAQADRSSPSICRRELTERSRAGGSPSSRKETYRA